MTKQFSLAKRSETYRWPVTIHEAPQQDGEKVDTTFIGVFKRVSASRVSEIFSLYSQMKGDDEAICSEVLVGWEGVGGPDGLVEFSEEALAEAREIQGFCRDVVLDWLDSVGRGKTKNSKKLPSVG